MDSMNKMIEIASKLKADQIKDMIIQLMDDSRDEAGIALEAAMIALENKIGIDEFVKFSEDL